MRQRSALRQHLRRSHDVVVVRGPGVSAGGRLAQVVSAGTEEYDLSTPVPRPREIDTVLVCVRDLPALRQAATAMAGLGQARHIGVVFEQPPSTLPTLVLRPDWPALEAVSGERADLPFVLLTFATPAPVRPVVIGLARSTQGNALLTQGWPMLGARRDRPGLWPLGDPATTVAVAARLHDTSVDMPPDIILNQAGDALGAEIGTHDHHVLGRAPVVHTVDPDVTWDDVARLGPAASASALEARGPLSLGGFDPRVLNPIGFDDTAAGPPGALRAVGGTAATAVVVEDRVVTSVDEGAEVTGAQVRLLRSLPGVRLDWEGSRGPQAYCRIVVQLAMAGVPLITDDVPAWARLLLPAGLVDALQGKDDLGDPLAREELSIRLRRAALGEHSLRAWRRGLAAAHGLPGSPPPRVSVLMATRRPAMLAFALRQAGRQRGVDAELILAAHGFEPDPEMLARFRDESGLPLTVLLEGSHRSFGDVLNRMVRAASGDVVLKMDDDDWYSPDFASDLLLAQEYSGADLVGTPPEFTFIEPLWVTTRRHDPTEGYHSPVAGGTMLVERGALRALGGFRSTVRHVDANLQSALTHAGGTIFRGHGLGYVLRRGHGGHTWDPGLGYFVKTRHAPVQWRGFRPSSLLEPDPQDLPSRGDDRVER